MINILFISNALNILMTRFQCNRHINETILVQQTQNFGRKPETNSCK